MSAPLRAPQHGSGKAHIHAFGPHAHFTELSYTYPLKLLSPNIPFAGNGVVPTGVAYMLSYGGGLVSGDRIELDVRVEEGVGSESELIGYQGSTKVFKSRSGADRHRLSSIAPSSPTTTSQHLTATLSPSSLFLLLPDPITCFSKASYTQIQTFHLTSTSSLVLLDWFTSGRMARGEEWEFERYYSRNEIWVQGVRVGRDAMLLEQTPTTPANGLPPRTLKDRLSPYSCYGTLFLVGPLVQDVVQSLQAVYSKISQRQRAEPEDLIWSLSPLTAGDGVCVRVAGKETELVREWLRVHLEGLASVVGGDVYNKAFV